MSHYNLFGFRVKFKLTRHGSDVRFVYNIESNVV